MCGVECVSDLRGNQQCFPYRQRARGETICQRWTFDELEDQRARVVDVFDAVDRAGAGLAIEPRAALGVDDPDGGDLDSHIATEPGVMRSIDFAHPACTQQGVDGEGAEAATDERHPAADG